MKFMDTRRKNIILASAIALFAVALYAYAIFRVATSTSAP